MSSASNWTRAIAVALLSSPVPTSAQQFATDAPYAGRYRCDETWRDAKLLIGRVRGDQIEGTLELTGRRLPVGRMSFRAMSQQPKFRGTADPVNGEVVLKTQDRIILGATDQERNVVLRGTLSRDGVLTGTLDYPGCDRVVVALAQQWAAVRAVEQSENRATSARLQARADSGWRQEADREMRPTLNSELALGTTPETLRRLADTAAWNKWLQRATPAFQQEARERVARRRTDIANELLALERHGLDDMDASLDGLAAGADWGNRFVRNYGTLDLAEFRALRDDYLQRRANQWTAANAQTVRARVQSAATDSQVIRVRRLYVGALDDVDAPRVQEILALSARREYYLRKVQAIGAGAVVPEARQALRVANPRVAPTTEDVYDAVVAWMDARNENVMSTRRRCDRLARGEERLSPSTPEYQKSLIAVDCLPYWTSDVGREPPVTVTRLSREGCRTAGDGRGWLCDFTQSTRTARPQQLSGARPADDPMSAFFRGAFNVADAMEQPLRGRFEVRQGRWTYTPEERPR